MHVHHETDGAYRNTNGMGKKLHASSEPLVCCCLLQVQRRWMYLDGIFTESIDIRLQLPEEAKKFDVINRRFLSIMKQTNENPNVLSAFCLENRLGEMKSLAAELDSCQRSLSDYLDAKRIMYPR